MDPAVLTFSGRPQLSALWSSFSVYLAVLTAWSPTPADKEVTWRNEGGSWQAFCDLASEITHDRSLSTNLARGSGWIDYPKIPVSLFWNLHGAISWIVLFQSNLVKPLLRIH